MPLGPSPTIAPLGDSAILVRFGDTIDPAVNDAVLALAASLDAMPLVGQRDLTVAYASLAVHCDPLAAECPGLDAIVRSVRERVERLEVRSDASPRLVDIPVCYDASVAPDVAAVAEHAGVAVDEVAALHSAAEYRVYMIGFTPGFPYLGGLDARLAMPRRGTPRAHVPAGSVAIGGAQTGIYPSESPGGWWVIGRTPVRLFEPERDPPSLLVPGDRVRFVPIAREELERTSL
jgi:inhibitor of KinA